MKEINVAGQKRTDLGKKASKQLRKQGIVPCNLYGEAKDEKGAPVAMALAIPMTNLRTAIYTPHVYVINLDIEREHHTAILKDPLAVSHKTKHALTTCSSKYIPCYSPPKLKTMSK